MILLKIGYILDSREFLGLPGYIDTYQGPDFNSRECHLRSPSIYSDDRLSSRRQYLMVQYEHQP